MSIAEKIRSASPESLRLWVTNIWYSRDTKICDVSLDDITFEDLAVFWKVHFVGMKKLAKILSNNFHLSMQPNFCTQFL